MVFSDSLKEGVDMLENNPKLGIYWTSVSVQAALKNHCKYMSIPSFEFRLPMSVLTTKNSTYVDIFNFQLSLEIISISQKCKNVILESIKC